jgi:hypothetical protein
VAVARLRSASQWRAGLIAFGGLLGYRTLHEHES